MSENPDPANFPCACSALRQVTRAVSRHYEACLAPTGTTTTQYSILRYLQREGTTALRRIADDLELERTSLYRAIAPLEQDRLISVRVDRDDARVKRATLSRRGAARIREVRPYWLRAQATFLTAVGDVEWSGVAKRLEGLRERMAEDPLVESQLGAGRRRSRGSGRRHT